MPCKFENRWNRFEREKSHISLSLSPLSPLFLELSNKIGILRTEQAC